MKIIVLYDACASAELVVANARGVVEELKRSGAPLLLRVVLGGAAGAVDERGERAVADEALDDAILPLDGRFHQRGESGVRRRVDECFGVNEGLDARRVAAERRRRER